MFFSSKKVIGVDLGSSSIKIVEMEPSGGKYNLISFGIIPTPHDAISNGQINNSAAISEAIHGLLREMKSKSKKAVTGMWGSSIIIKKINIPKVDKVVLKETIRFEAENYIPFDIASVSLCYEILPSSRSDETMDVLIIAAKNDELVQFAEVLTLSGLNCSVMDANSVALANCFELNYGSLRNETVAIMNFGSECTNFIVMSEGSLIFCRDIGVGGGSINTEICRSMGVSMAQAESFKVSALSGAEVPDEVHAALNAETERMVEEIKNGFDFFAASNNGIAVSRIYYSGGGSYLNSLIQQLGISLGVPFEKLDPFRNIKVNPKKFNDAYLDRISVFAPIAIGLAARGANKS